MRKNLLKSLLLTLMVLVGGSAWGIEVKTTFDFSKGTSGTTPTLSSSVHHKAGNSSNVYLATDDICKSRFCFQAVSTTDHVFEYSNSKIQQTKGDRWFSVVDLKAGDKIAFTFTVANAGSSTDKHFTVENAGTGTSTNLSLTEDGDAIAANTDMVSETEYYVLADGYLDFKTRKNFYLTKVVITSEVGEETVSKPELSITGANLGARTVTIKRGESSLNNTTTTYYTIDGSAPTTASTSSANQYTPVLVGEGATEEATVTVKAISVSSGNVSSEVAELAVPVGTTIQLDAPTIAVTGMALNGDVYNPVFTFTGTQSVIGKPTATLSYSIDEGAATEGASCTVTAPGTLRVTVSAEGYASNYKDFVIKNATYTLSKTIDLSASDYVDVTGFGEGSANAHWANFGTMNATIYTLPETTSLPGITLNSVTYSQFSLGLGLGFASGTRTATINDTAEGEIGEFVLYTGGNLADEKNVSAFVEYNEGITFTLPVTGSAQALKKINVYTPKVEVPVFDPATAIKNANFEGTAIDNHLCGYGKDMSNNGTTYYGLLDIDGWQKVVVSGDNSTADYPNSGMGGAVFAYGTEYQLRGNSKAAPAEGPEGTNGKALGFFGVWGLGGYYYQDVTLPAGTYTLNIPMYNQSGTQANESYTGFFVKDSDVKYTVAVNPAVGAWTVQSVNFTLETETTGEIRVGYKSTGSGSGANPMLFIDGVQLLTELDGAKALYNTALAAANAAAADEVVTGEEKTTLNQVIAANSDVDTTSVEALKTAATALNEAVATFNAAKADYQDLAELKTDITMVNYNDRFTYASADKKTAAETALNAEAATSAADAKAKAEAIRKAYRAFADSHAMAEGVEGAVNMTDKIANPNAESAIADPWKLVNGEGSNGSLSIKGTDQEPPTDGEGNTYKYFDGGNWNANAWNVALQQNVNLPAGKYLLTVAGRAANEVTMTVFAGTNERGIPAIGSTGGLFGRGWNNADLEFEMAEEGNITIGVKGETETIHNWMSFTRFRLVQLEATAVAPVDPNDFTSYIVNADLTGEGGFDATGTKGLDGSGIVKVGNAAAFDFKQTIANLPAGKYKVTAQAAYRYGADEAAEAAAIAAETDTKLVQLYATVGEKTVSTKVLNRYDGASETDYANGNGSVTVNEKFVPNSSDAVKAWFAAGQYVNEVIFNLPADGAVTIGINRTGTPESDYTVIGPWTLTRLGDAEVEPEPQPEPQPQPGDDMTKYIVNPSFETGNLTGWTVGNSSDTGVKPNSDATYTTEGCDGDYVFNTWWQGIPITQTVKGLPNGLYELKALMTNDAITAGNKPCLYLLANGAHSEAFSSANAGVFAEGSMQFYVTDGTATIGAVGGNADGTFNEGGYYWYKADNFRLKYLEAMPKIEDIEIPEGKMSIAAANAMTAAKEAGDVVALIQAVSNAKNSIAAYAHVKDVLDFMAEEVAKTNVYTVAAKEKFDSICTATLNGYNEGTISDADAAAFNYGSRLDGILPNLLLSAYTSIVDGTPYINSWSTEGNNDGSDFKTPFFEYWVGDGDALAANTITAKVEGVEPGDYDITALVRVRIKNGAEAPATSISLNAGTDAVTIAGTQIGTSPLYIGEYKVTATVAEDGILTFNFNVAADGNVSWLSFKNVKFEKKPAKVEPIEGISYSWESPAGEPIEWGGTIAYVNGDGNRLNYQNSGYYTICLNGKKANMNDEVASANAGKMVITLDNAVAAGDTIAITGYITKKNSAKASAYIVFDNGKNIESEVFGDEANIYNAEDSELSSVGAITTKNVIISDEAAGSKTITMTRGQTGTNLFITKLQIIEKKESPLPNGISTVKTSNQNGTIFNLNGQKVNKAHKGLYIINGKKVVIK